VRVLREEYVLIMNSKPPISDKIYTLGMALKQFNHDQIYMRPVLRELLGRNPEQRPFNMGGKADPKDLRPVPPARLPLFQDGYSRSWDFEGEQSYSFGSSQSSMRTPLEDLGWIKATFVL